MKTQSMIVDDFFKRPETVRRIILKTPMMDEQASDGVSYPGIVRLSDALTEGFKNSLHNLIGKEPKDFLCFARHSMEGMTPPNWAHCDTEMADYVALIYLDHNTEGSGTHMVRHKRLDFNQYIKGLDDYQEQASALVHESNIKENWEIEFTCPAKFNRLFLVNADYLHAASEPYGDNRDNSRLVLTGFFRL